MDEGLFRQLAALLADQPVVLAQVQATRGATPRKVGSRMLITPQCCYFSIGGGLAEARVIAAARALLVDPAASQHIDIDLGGGAGAAGVCGGQMQIGLRCWTGEVDRRRAQAIADTMRAGHCVAIQTEDSECSFAANHAQPDPRLLIVGAGHCGAALVDLARTLDFDVWLYDSRDEAFAHPMLSRATTLSGSIESLRRALDTSRNVYAVLLNRDFQADVDALRVLAPLRPHWLAMMGSGRRIGTVLQALPEHRDALRDLIAPVGLPIGAQTPHEIAISILAQIIQHRHRSDLA